jgi:hypothetical protein
VFSPLDRFSLQSCLDAPDLSGPVSRLVSLRNSEKNRCPLDNDPAAADITNENGFHYL